MCGLTGILSARSVDLADIRKMNLAQAHRGPDGGGFAVFDGQRLELSTGPTGRLALGHQRLSIFDLSETGDQPMQTRDGRFVIVYNGAIYNYVELRDELQTLGHSFIGTSDTEVLLNAFATWGPDAFRRFNGMWAAAILDRKAGTLTLSRDRFGIKPLHLAVDHDRLLFASELKSILAVRRQAAKLSMVQALSYLRDGLVNETDDTFIEDVKSFPPGHFAVVALERPTEVNPSRYWSLPEGDELGSSLTSKRDAEAELKELLTSSIKMRLRSDVPVGTCLSGGLDSSSIVSIATGLLARHECMDVFTASFDEPRLDELRYAEAVSTAVGARQNVVTPDERSLEEDWPALVRAQDEPFGSLSIFAQWCVMRLARERGVKVLLDGQGGDEAMAGYRKFVVLHCLNLLRRRNLGTLAAFLASTLVRGDRGLLKVAEGKRYLPRALQARIPGLGDGVRGKLKGVWGERSAFGIGGTTVEERQVDDLVRYSLPALLRYEDRNSMAFGIEARVPFLDYRLVETLLRYSPGLKFAGGQTKALLRGALKGRVPDVVLKRRDKLGFAPPQQAWLKGRFGDRIKARMQSSDFQLDHLVDPDHVKGLLVADGAFAAASQAEAFRVYSLDCWAAEFGVDCH